MKGFIGLFIIFLTDMAMANISFNPFYVDFGDLSVDRNIGRSRTVYLNNNTNRTIHVNLHDNCFRDFYINQYCYVLNPYASCPIRIEFRPQSIGYMSCNIQAQAGADGFDVLRLSGKGVGNKKLELNGIVEQD